MAPSAATSARAVVFDLDETLVPLETLSRWQWAWRPTGPVLSERHARSAIRRQLRAWDRRRWRGLVGADPATTPEDYRSHLVSTLLAIADRPLPDEEVRAVIDRFLKPVGPVERFADVQPALRDLAERSIPFAVVASLSDEAARAFLVRGGLDPSVFVPLPADALPPPHRTALKRACLAVKAAPSETLFVGDLYWSDARAARRAGLRSVLLEREGGTPSAAAVRIRSLSELPTVLDASEASDKSSDTVSELPKD